jgi:hypothetical protein
MIPAIALVLCAWLITGVSRIQALTGMAAFFMGILVYAVAANKNVLATNFSDQDATSAQPGNS